MRSEQEASDKGAFNYVTAFLLVIVAVALFAGLFILPKYMDNYTLSQELYRLMVNAPTLTDPQIAVKLTEYADKKKIPLTLTDIVCLRSGGVINCKYEYKWPVAAGGTELFVLTMKTDKSRNITEVMDRLSKP
jgi:hypothetical protein